jgi:hypothetical protein
MPVLLPKESIDAAISVYNLKDNSEASRKVAFAKAPELQEKFDLTGKNTFSSTTGTFIFKSTTGFGVIAMGKGAYEKEAILIIRGTASSYDWMTDFNCAVAFSRTGQVIHTGFNRVFNEFEPDLINFFKQNKPEMVHCVGHSLGGALASISAEWLTYNNIAKPYLYTFGSPRVGFSSFASELTRNVEAKNIFRIHHNNDIVSLVPLWPFVHVPVPGESYCILNSPYNPISAHYKDNYLKTIKGHTEWSTLQGKSNYTNSEELIINWLTGSKIMALTTYTINMIGSAVMYILKISGILLQNMFMPGMTILDQLSFALERAWKSTKEIAGYVVNLIKKIYVSVTGRAFTIVGDITTALIRMIFELLTRAIFSMVNTAIAADTSDDK